jgi:hypothetical protein
MISFLIYLFQKNIRKRKDYKKLDDTQFNTNVRPEEKLSNFQNEFEKNKEINDLNKWGSP